MGQEHVDHGLRTPRAIYALQFTAALCLAAGLLQIFGGHLYHLVFAALYLGAAYGLFRRTRTGGYFAVAAGILVGLFNLAFAALALSKVVAGTHPRALMVLLQTLFWVMLNVVILSCVGWGWGHLKAASQNKGGVRGAI